ILFAVFIEVEGYELRMSCTSAHQQVARKERRAYMWSGELPPRNYSHPVFSCKIFVGGVPWDVSEDALLEAFSPYGRCKVEWPGNEARFARPGQRGGTITRGKVTGYVYMIFDHEHSVRHLLRDCSQEFGSAGEWYFRLKAKRNNTIETRQVQIIPWVVSDASYVEDPGDRLDAKKTVFVGALHGMITAHVLFSIMNELYGKVVFVGIDTDKYKYPIGSGRVTFSSHSSYFRAIECAFLEIKTSKFSKRVQIDPFLEESECMICHQAVGPFFCRDRACFRYHCGTCWQRRHPAGSPNAAHRYLTRNTPRSNRDPIETINIGNLAVSDVTPGPRSVFHPLSWMLPLSF
ncbi:cpb-3, partial [Pristionchus pacificus]